MPFAYTKESKKNHNKLTTATGVVLAQCCPICGTRLGNRRTESPDCLWHKGT